MPRFGAKSGNATNSAQITAAAASPAGWRRAQRRAFSGRPRRLRLDGLVFQDVRKVVGERGRALVPPRRILLERGLDDDLEIARNRGIELPRMGVEPLDRLDERGPVGVLERTLESEALEQRHAEREDVGARIGRRAAREELLRRHVGRRAEHVSGQRHRRGVALQVPREAEVEDRRAAGAAHHDVAGLDVAVDDPRRVRRVQRASTLLDQGHHAHDRVACAVLRRGLARSALVRIRNRDRPGHDPGPLPRPGDPLGESLAIEESHHDVMQAFVLPGVEHGADARVVNLRGGFGLPRESREHLRRGGQRARHNLESHLSREPRVLREEHDALTSAPDLPHETVWPDQPARYLQRGRREQRHGRQADLLARFEDFGVVGGDPRIIAREPGEIIP